MEIGSKVLILGGATMDTDGVTFGGIGADGGGRQLHRYLANTVG